MLKSDLVPGLQDQKDALFLIILETIIINQVIMS